MYHRSCKPNCLHFGQSIACVCEIWWPTEAVGGPYAGLYQMVAKGAKTFNIQVGQRQEIISVDCLKAHFGSSPVSPVEAASLSSPLKKPATPRIQPVTL